jgi:hypothetical protein
MAIKAGYLIAAGGGIVLIWSGVKGKSWSTVLRDVVSGQKPTTAFTAYPITSVAGQSGGSGGGGGVVPQGKPPSTASVAALKVYARTLLIAHGWPGQFPALNNIVIAESGWNSKALNPSGAWGVAQALGHGTPATDAGNGHNQYGNFSTPNRVCKMANAGNGAAQLIWMCNYIKKFGSPNAAWAYHLAHGSY